MSKTLEGKVAVVTGSGGGIGRATAVLMASEGAKVVVNDIGAPPSGVGGGPTMADETVGLIKAAGGEAVANYDSVATMDGASGIIGAAIDSFGRIDCLVNNAGNTRVNMIWDMPEEDFDAVVSTHLKGTFCTVKAAIPHMIKQRSGSIVNVASGMGIEGGTGVSNYSAAKGGILGFTATLCLELGVYGLRVNALCPSATSRMRTAGEEWRKNYRLKVPQRLRSGLRGPREPSQVASLIAYLARDEARDINGQVFFAGSEMVGIYPRWNMGATAYKEGGEWTQEELARLVPGQLLAGTQNPSPPQDEPIVWPWLRP